jgi:hypothetical protein
MKVSNALILEDIPLNFSAVLVPVIFIIFFKVNNANYGLLANLTQPLPPSSLFSPTSLPCDLAKDISLLNEYNIYSLGAQVPLLRLGLTTCICAMLISSLNSILFNTNIASISRMLPLVASSICELGFEFSTISDSPNP